MFFPKFLMPVTDMGFLGSLLSGLGGLFGGGDEESINLESMMPSWVKSTGSNLANWVSQYLNKYIPGQEYQGKMTADMTPFEKTGLGFLEQYMKQPNTGKLFEAGQNELLKTLGGQYMDVAQSPLVRALQDQAGLGYEDMVNQIRARRGGRGTYFTKEGIAEEARAGTRQQADLNTIIGQLLNEERGRQFSAVGPAMQYEQYGQQAPLQKVAASQQYGGLQRLIEQSDLERRYQDYVRQRNEMRDPLQAAQGLVSSGPGYFGTTGQMPVTGGGSGLGGLLSGLLGNLNLSGIGNIFGGMFGGSNTGPFSYSSSGYTGSPFQLGGLSSILGY